MKTLPAFPFVFAYSGTPYAAVSKDSENRLTLVVLAGSGRGQIYANNISESNLLGDIVKGSAKIVGQIPKEEALATSLKIDVDSSQLDKSLATAQELEATMKRLAGGLK